MLKCKSFALCLLQQPRRSDQSLGPLLSSWNHGIFQAGLCTGAIQGTWWAPQPEPDLYILLQCILFFEDSLSFQNRQSSNFLCSSGRCAIRHGRIWNLSGFPDSFFRWRGKSCLPQNSDNIFMPIWVSLIYQNFLYIFISISTFFFLPICGWRINLVSVIDWRRRKPWPKTCTQSFLRACSSSSLLEPLVGWHHYSLRTSLF